MVAQAWRVILFFLTFLWNKTLVFKSGIWGHFLVKYKAGIGSQRFGSYTFIIGLFFSHQLHLYNLFSPHLLRDVFLGNQIIFRLLGNSTIEQYKLFLGFFTGKSIILDELEIFDFFHQICGFLLSSCRSLSYWLFNLLSCDSPMIESVRTGMSPRLRHLLPNFCPFFRHLNSLLLNSFEYHILAANLCINILNLVQLIRRKSLFLCLIG